MLVVSQHPAADAESVEQRIAQFWQRVDALAPTDLLTATDLGQWAMNVIERDPGAGIRVDAFRVSTAAMQSAFDRAGMGVPPGTPKTPDVEQRIAQFWQRIDALGPADLLAASDVGQWALNVTDRDPNKRIRVDDFRAATAGMQGGFDAAKALPRPETPAPTPVRQGLPTSAPVSAQPGRTIRGDWVIGDAQVIQDERITVYGKVQIRPGASLTMKRATLEISGPGSSVDPYSADTSLRLDGGSLDVSDSTIAVFGQRRAAVSIQRPRAVAIRRTTFDGLEVSLIDCTSPAITDSTFYMDAGQGFSQALALLNCSAGSVSGNKITARAGSGPAGMGIWLLRSRSIGITANEIVGTKNGIGLTTSWDNRISGNAWTGPSNRQGEAGISLQQWANNNVIEKNTLQNAGSAILFIFQSRNNRISGNTIRKAGLGVVLRWASQTVIEGNDIRDLLEDGVRLYRSYDSSVLNNRIADGSGGLGLFSSWSNTVKGNTLSGIDRGIFLADASGNVLGGNDLSEGIEGVVLTARSRNNEIGQNNITSFARPGYDEGTANTWSGNYWGRSDQAEVTATPNGVDRAPARARLTPVPAAVPAFVAIPYQDVRDDRVRISAATTWDRQTKTLPSGVVIESGGSLVVRNSTVTVDPSVMQVDTWILVRSGGSLEIEGSKLYGPTKDHSLTVKAEPGARLVMRGSELHDGGSWVGTFAAAVALEGSGAIVENNRFFNVYCAISSERASDLRIVGNTVTNTVEGVTIIGTTPRTVVEGNRIVESAIWGIQVWSNQPNIGSDARGNTVEGGWGVGVYDANPGSFAIDGNVSSRVRGIGALHLGGSGGLDARQVRVFSAQQSAARAGDDIEVVVNMKNTVQDDPPFGTRSYDVSLRVGATAIDTRRVTLGHDQGSRVTLHGTAPAAGEVVLVIDAPPR